MHKEKNQSIGLASLKSQPFTQVIMQKVTCIKNSEGMPYCIFKKDTESKVFDLSSVEFRNEISNLYYEIHLYKLVQNHILLFYFFSLQLFFELVF